MTDTRERKQASSSIDKRLEAIRMTPSERAAAHNALELGTRAAGLITAAATGLRWLIQVPVARRAGRKAAAAAKRSGDATVAHANPALRRSPQSAS